MVGAVSGEVRCWERPPSMEGTVSGEVRCWEKHREGKYQILAFLSIFNFEFLDFK